MKLTGSAVVVAGLGALLMTVGCVDKDPRNYVQAAHAAMAKNDLKTAAIEFKNSLRVNPNLSEARFMLGSILLKQPDPAAAAVEFRKALAAGYSITKVVPELAKAMVLIGQHKKLVDEFGNLALKSPEADASLQTSLAAAHAALGRPDKAQAALAAALAADPAYVPALLVAARQKAATRDFDGALQSLGIAIAKDSANAEAWTLNGDILRAKDSWAEALAAYRKAIEVDPKFVPGHLAVVALLLRQGNLEEAAKQVEILKAAAPNDPQGKFFEATVAYQKKNFKLARDLVQQLLPLAPDRPLLLELAGAVELKTNSLVQAEVYLSRALELAPGLMQARHLLIMTHLQSGQPARALAALNAAPGIQLDPRSFSLAGEVYLQNGDVQKAHEFFAKAVKLDPDSTAKRTALAVTRFAGGQEDAALEEMQATAMADSGATADLALITGHLRRNDFARAHIAINKLEAKQPDVPFAAILRGQVQLSQKDKAAARKSFERALVIDRSSFGAAFALATLDLDDKKPDDAKRRFEALLAQDRKHPQALLALAHLAAASGGNKEEVAALLNRAVDANPVEITPRLQLIEHYLGTKDNKQALGTAQAAIAAMPSSPELMDALGRVQQLSGDFNQAIATFGKLSKMQPLEPRVHLRLAGAHLAAGNHQAAESALRHALEIKPDVLDAQRGLVVLALEAKKPLEALKIARTVQEQRPTSPLGFALEGDIDASQMNWDGAAAAYRQALQRASTTELSSKLVTALISAGKTSDAEKFIATWLRDHPKDAVFLLQLGDLSLNRKDYPSAEKYYQAALRLGPDSVLALNNLALVTMNLRKDGALEYAERANRLLPNQPLIMDTLAMALTTRGEHVRAIKLQSRAVAMQPSNGVLTLNLAKIYLAAGDKASAKTELDKLAALGKKSPVHKEVKDLLKTL